MLILPIQIVYHKKLSVTCQKDVCKLVIFEWSVSFTSTPPQTKTIKNETVYIVEILIVI